MNAEAVSSEHSDQVVLARRTGGRSARVVKAVLDSALTELCEVGYIGFSIAAVAKRAEVHETTIYRRWPKREDLIEAACMAFADAKLPVPNTGDLKEDLRIVLSNITSLMSTPIGQALTSLMFSSRYIAEFSGSSVTFWRIRMNIGQQVFQHAIERGEWPKDYDKTEVFSELIGPIIARYFFLQELITQDVIDTRVDAIVQWGRQRL